MQTFKDEGISGSAIAKPPGLQDLLAVVAKLTCGVCGGPMIRSGADQRFMCSWRRERCKMACTNGRGIKSAEIEARVLAAIKRVFLRRKAWRWPSRRRGAQRRMTRVRLSRLDQNWTASLRKLSAAPRVW